MPIHSPSLGLLVGFQHPFLQALSLLREVSLLAEVPADLRRFRVSVNALLIT